MEHSLKSSSRSDKERTLLEDTYNQFFTPIYPAQTDAAFKQVSAYNDFSPVQIFPSSKVAHTE